jgi:hypothetical protein
MHATKLRYTPMQHYHYTPLFSICQEKIENFPKYSGYPGSFLKKGPQNLPTQ